MKYIKKNNLNISNDDNNLMQDLMHFIYNSFQLDHDKMKPLYDHIDVPNTFDDDDSSFDDDNDEYIDKYASIRGFNGDIDLEFTDYHEEDDKYYYIYNGITSHKYKNESFIKEIYKYLSEKSPRKLRIFEGHNLLLINKSGLNSYTGGCKYLDWRLHFWPEYKVSKKRRITLHDLIIGASKIKSHKFENFYEKYLHVKDFKINDDCIQIEARFDHGM